MVFRCHLCHLDLPSRKLTFRRVCLVAISLSTLLLIGFLLTIRCQTVLILGPCLQIPLYAAYKLYTSVIGPMLGLRSPKSPVAVPAATNGNGTTSDVDTAEAISRKQQKAQKKAEKKSSTGIPRR